MRLVKVAEIDLLKQGFQRDVSDDAREFLRMTGDSDTQRRKFAEQLDRGDFNPPGDASDGYRAALLAAEATVGRQAQAFRKLYAQTENGELSSDVVLQCLPESSSTYFWFRCAIEYSRLTSAARTPTPSAERDTRPSTPPEPLPDPERSLLSAGALLADELGLRKEEVVSAFTDHSTSLRPEERTFVDLVRSVRDAFAAERVLGAFPAPLQLLTALRAAYAFRRWARVKEFPMELPTEFLAALLQQMGIRDLVQFHRFEEFVYTLQKSGTEEIKDLFPALKPHFLPPSNGGDASRRR